MDKNHSQLILKSYMEAHGFSQRGFSKICGLHYSSLNLIMTGKRKMTADIALMIKKATNGELTLDQLLG